jgi:hypothetical protein
MDSSCNTNSNTGEPDRMQDDRPAACDIAQQYSSASCFSIRFPFHKKKIRRLSKCYFSCLMSLKLRKSGSVSEVD